MVKHILSLVFVSVFSFCVLQFPLVASSADSSPAQAVKDAAPAKGGESFNDALKAENHGAQPEMSPAQVSGGSAAAVAPLAEGKVEKATGDNAYTVQEIFAKKKELAGKIVRVRGKVVKFNPAIMGKNWIHIQDGTGDPLQNSHDLVVTSADGAKVGEILTVEGKLASDKDFGAGYTYAAIIEEAKLKN
jgi:hypothetical protein